VIAISLRPAGRDWNTISFASTLYLLPVLDLLLTGVPKYWKAEVRLGLQEALVNAAKHGNKLDPGKKVFVRFSTATDQYWWVISDQGPGFKPETDCACELELNEKPLADEKECGRGMYILHQVFDQVHWNSQGTELRLCKQVRKHRAPLVV
jgi:serine/threonine-protein kinase RsbW